MQDQLLESNQPFQRSLERSLEKFAGAPCPERLQQSIAYSLLSPGKRIRPRLMFASGKLFGLTQEQLLPAALAIEMIHCFSLIHDDLPCMDDDDFRRGRPSNHKQFDEPTALLAGDGLVALAFENFLELIEHFPASNVIYAQQKFLKCVGLPGMIGGQVKEMGLSQNGAINEIIETHRMKTGALFFAAICLPTWLRKESNQELEFFAQNLGQAFQIADDLDDYQQDQAAHKDPHNLIAIEPDRGTLLRVKADLENNMQTLQKKWPQTSSQIISIAQEVLRSLQ